MFDALSDFLEPVSLSEISQDGAYREGQIGRNIKIYDTTFPDLDEVNIVLVGCGEQRGAAIPGASQAPAAIRQAFFELYHWHSEIKLADVGNIRIGKSYTDTYAALRIVLHDLVNEGKMVVVLGGSHDLTLAQYYAFADDKKMVEAIGADAMIDVNIESPFRNDNFLMELLTSDPNYLRQYNHIGFQSYLVHPRMLETMDKLRFDCFRVGAVKEEIEEMEPVVRNCHFFSFDITAMANAYAPANALSPNGLTGEEACTLMQYAGMGPEMRSVGIYGYQPERDRDSLTAKQISQMLWYLMDGKNRGMREAGVDERELFNEFHTSFSEVETLFLQSKKTGRWWMQLPDKKFVACSYKDYIQASSNQIPERWLRAQERP